MKHKAPFLFLILLLCLLGNVAADLSTGGLFDTSTFTDSDDEAALPSLLAATALSGFVVALTFLSLVGLSQRWPPPLQPPQSR